MRIRLGIVDARAATVPTQRTERLVEVLVEAPAGAAFGDLRPHLTRLLATRGSEPLGFDVDGRPVTDEAMLGEGDLLRGAVLTARPTGSPAPGRMPPGPVALLELAVVGGPGAGRTFPLSRGEHVVGRAIDCGIRLEDLGASRAHGVLSVSDSGVTLRDLEPTNPSAVDGVPVPSPGTTLRIGARVRLGSTTLVLRRPSPRPATIEAGEGVVRFHRPPRFVARSTVPSIEFPQEPTRPEGQRLPLLASIIPLALSAALALALGSPMMLLFALMSPVLLLGQWWSDRRHGRTSYRRLLAEHRRAVEAANTALEEAVAAERQARHAEHPDLATVGQVALWRDARLWERRPDDADHLVVRLGTADQPSRVELSGDGPREAVLCPEVPALCSFTAAGVIGIAGDRETALSLSGAMLAQLCTWHSPQFLRLVLLTSSAVPEADWGWACRLPHLSNGDTSVAAAAATGDETAVTRRVSELLHLVDERRVAASAGPAAPSVIVVLDGAQILRSVPGVPLLLRDGPAVGLHVLCIDSHRDRLPAETSTVVDLVPGPRARAGMTDTHTTLADIVPDLPSRSWLERVARHLSPLEDATPERVATPLRAAVGFREVHVAQGMDPTSVEALVRAWSSVERGSARATLGMTHEGPYAVDLAQDGPHVLVGGTTGAGKSELLQTLVAGLAVSNRPDQLSFVLIDYKGGSAFKECARLPHTLGVVTDLDQPLTTRALVSLDAELKRRERLLAQAGAKDLDEYTSFKGGGGSELTGIPRLVLVVDEFKLLADELPDFVAGLVRVAAVGRSLGIHLVLATQRPAGIITGDIRANISLRIALRVRDRSDSDDVIEGPQAASISDRMPGRAWVRTGGQRLLEVQTAHAGALMAEEAATSDPADNAVKVWPIDFRGLARPWPVSESAQETAAGRTELAAFVDAARSAAQILSIEPEASPWLPALPEAISLDALPTHDMSARTGETAHGRSARGEVPARSGGARLGLVDLPQEQRQDVLCWDTVADGHLGIAGGARSGRSTALTALALELAANFSPGDLHLHVLAGSGSPLKSLGGLPHVGSVVGADDPLLARRVILRLLEETAARGRSMSAGVAGPAPLVVLLVDGWESLEDAFDEVEHGAPTEELLRLLRDGLSAGVRVVVTGGRSLVSGRLAGLLQRRLVLPMPDPLDLTLAGLDPVVAAVRRPAGRAIDPHTGAEVQLAHAGASPSPEAQRQAVEMVGAALRAQHREAEPSRLPWHVRPLPERVILDDIEPQPGLIRLGVGGDDAQAVSVDPASAPPGLLVVGPPRSGRSTTLALVAQELASTGRPLAIVTTGRSPLTELSGIPGVTLLHPSESERFIELRRTSPELGIVVDDAEDLDGTPIGPAVLEAARLLDTSGGYCAVAVDVHRTSGLYRGLVIEVARHQTGIVLSPAASSDGELLRTRVDVPRHRIPGRGIAIIDGAATPIQVASSSPWPHSTRHPFAAAVTESVGG